MKPILYAVIATVLCGCVSQPSQSPIAPPRAMPNFALHPLTVPVRTRDLAAFRTIGEMANYLTARTGYAIALQSPAPPEANTIAQWPPNPRIFSQGIMPAEAIIAGALYPEAQLVIDPANRLISFRFAGDAGPHSNPYAFPLTGEYLRLIP